MSDAGADAQMITAAMDLTAMMAITDVARETGASPTDVVGDFLASETARQLYDDSLKLWWDGPACVAAQYLRERGLA